MENELFESLKNAQWNTLSRTYGSSHCTLIGLIVDWWLTYTPQCQQHRVLESGLTVDGKRSGHKCDAILLDGNNFEGVVEVEGTNYPPTIKKIEEYFASKHLGYLDLKFGVLLAYGYAYRNRIKRMNEFIDLGKDLTKSSSCVEKQLFVLALDKLKDKLSLVPHKLNDYCQQPFEIRGVPIRNGKVGEICSIWRQEDLTSFTPSQ